MRGYRHTHDWYIRKCAETVSGLITEDEERSMFFIAVNINDNVNYNVTVSENIDSNDDMIITMMMMVIQNIIRYSNNVILFLPNE